MTLQPKAAARRRLPPAASGETPPRFDDLGSGTLELRLAADAADLAAAQALRYRVFYDEMAARPTPEMMARGHDFDEFDALCDHLLVIDSARGRGADGVIATYRLLRGEVADRNRGFYTAGEYEIDCLRTYPGRILELGRSCVDAGYRSRPTMQLLWAGIARYVLHYGIRLMFGCASLHGTDAARLAMPLSYLYHFHLAPPALRPRALADRRVDMNFMPADRISEKEALAALPPLVKGYLRLGAFIGDGAVVDEQFNTTDVCIIVNTELITERYYRHYARNQPALPDEDVPA
ncbi:MAG: GNAT family N-acetyltransferase [Alphaproteobacteria bacterium]